MKLSVQQFLERYPPDRVEGGKYVYEGNLNLSELGLTSVEFPEDMHVRGSLWLHNNNLTEVIFPEGTYVGGSLWLYNNDLTEVVFPEDMHVKGSLYLNNNNLTEVVFPEGMQVDWDLYLNDNNLTKVVFPEDMHVGDYLSLHNNNFKRLPDHLPGKRVSIFNEVPFDFKKSINLLNRIMSTKKLQGYDLVKAIWDKTITIEQILQIENIEQRYTALQWVGVGSLLDKATLLDRQKKEVYNEDVDLEFDGEKIVKAEVKKVNYKEITYELYKLDVPKILDETMYVLRYWCPSTDEEYISYTTPEIGRKKDVFLAMAHKQNITKEQFLNQKYEA